MQLKSQYIDELIKIVFNNTGISLAGYRKPMLSRRISDRLGTIDMEPEQYISLCRENSKECRELVNTIAINVSHFFRNPIVFEIIKQIVLPNLLAREDPELRVWSAGCAAGEEAYSIAILIDQALKIRKDQDIDPLIFATDIDQHILEKAKEGKYPRDSFKDTKLGIIDSFFSIESDEFKLNSEIKKMVDFSLDDLLSSNTVSPPVSIFGSFDLILCRNVLIYFSEIHQNQVIEKLYKSLAQGGYLVLGDSEFVSKNLKSRFKTVDSINKIFQK